jgi:hypothetical protein
MSYSSAEYTVYFGPPRSQPYHVLRAGQWLASIGKFQTADQATEFLYDLESTKPQLFKYYMSEYHRINSFQVGYLKAANTDQSKNKPKCGYAYGISRGQRGSAPYGEESHMWYQKL